MDELKNVLSYLSPTEAATARHVGVEYNRAAAKSAADCAVITGKDGQRCLTALRAAAPENTLVEDVAGREGDEDADDVEGERARTAAAVRKQMRALGPSCMKRCTSLLAARVVRGLKALADIAVRPVRSEEYPAIAPTADEERAIAAAALRGDDVEVDRLRYDRPHLGGIVNTVITADGDAAAKVTVEMTRDELLLLCHSPAVVRAERNAPWPQVGARPFTSRMLVSAVGAVLDGRALVATINGPPVAVIQALAREVVARAGPALAALLAELAPRIARSDYEALEHEDTKAETETARHPETRLRDDSRMIGVTFYAYLVYHDELGTATAQRKVERFLPVFAATAPQLVREWIAAAEAAAVASEPEAAAAASESAAL